MTRALQFTVNGIARSVTIDPERPLLEVLREDLALTGTKFGCGEGHCAACTVLIDGRNVMSCQTPAGEADGKTIITIEGLASDGRLHAVQEAFLAEEGYQCGYCTAGMVVATVALLNQKPNPTDAEIRTWLNGHLCRCCGYPKILNSVRRAAILAKGGKP